MTAKLQTTWIRLLAMLLCIVSLLLLCAMPVMADGEADEKYPLHENSPLQDKKVLFCGDSICAASTHDYKGQQWWGWAKRIGKAYGLKTVKNAGADGASISNVRGSNTVLNQIKSNKFGKYDMVVLHGGTNDGWDEVAVGEMTAPDCFTLKSFDVSTYAGGLENLFCTAKELFPDAIICYVINFQTPSGIGTLKDMSAYYTVGKQICEKWQIPYLDLYFDEPFNQNVFRVKQGRYTADKIHPNGKGYDILYTVIGDFMEQLVLEAEKPVEPEDPTSEVTSEVTSGATSEVSSGATSEVTSGGDTQSGGGNHTFLLIVGLLVAALFLCTGVIVMIRKKGKKQA